MREKWEKKFSLTTMTLNMSYCSP